MNPFVLQQSNSVLVVLDLQERLMPAIASGDSVLYNACRMTQVALELNVPLVVTEQNPEKLGRTSASLLNLLPQETPLVTKSSFSCCDEPAFLSAMGHLTPRNQIIITGTESHICVCSTVMGLLARKFQVALVADGCGSRNPEHHHMALETMRAAGAAVLPLESLAYQLMGKAGSPEFRALLPLFK